VIDLSREGYLRNPVFQAFSLKGVKREDIEFPERR
jgi:hypothetical protein